MERREAESFLRRVLQQYGQDHPLFQPCSESGQAPPQVFVPETLNRTSEPQQEVHPVCTRSEREGQCCGGAACDTALRSSVAAFSSNRKNIQGTGSLLLFADIGEPEAPESSLCHCFCAANLAMTGVEILRYPATYKDQPCASVLCPLCNITDGRLQFLLSCFPFLN